MAITPGKLQTQSSAHASVIRPDTTPAKYLPRLLIYAVIALVPPASVEPVRHPCFATRCACSAVFSNGGPACLAPDLDCGKTQFVPSHSTRTGPPAARSPHGYDDQPTLRRPHS